jgi:hypothetical protein
MCLRLAGPERPEIAVESVDHLIRYLKLLFGPEKIENPK